MHGKPCRGERLNPIRGVMSLRNALDCRALKMPGYLFLLDKADKQRTKDPGLCNLGCSSPATILRRSQGGGGRMSSRQEAPSVAIISPCRCGRKPRRLPRPALGRSTKRSLSSFPGSVRHNTAVSGYTQSSANPQPRKCHRLPSLAVVFHMSKQNSSEKGGAGRARPSRAWRVFLAGLTTAAPGPSPALQLLGPHPCPARGQT